MAMNPEPLRLMVTGGAGFIGSTLCRYLIAQRSWHVVNVDKLTYSANPASLDTVAKHASYRFYQLDIGDQAGIERLLREERIDVVVHLAAETHVDRSIDQPAAFLETNVIGTGRLLDAALGYWRSLGRERARRFRFHYVSTDEVFGDLDSRTTPFTEESNYAPSSPYSASKAAADHLVRAWHRTYGLPVLLSHSSNNYGPGQHLEKLIPLTIVKALLGESLPVYGDGLQVRDWLFVEDHVRALARVMRCGRIGETYLIGGRSERTNLSVVEAICDLLDSKAPLPTGPRRELIRFVPDRPGHDRRYAVDTSKIEQELGWQPGMRFDEGLERTIDWYLVNASSWQAQRTASERVGLGR